MLLIGFAGSIVATRVYLAATGYPTVGGDILHVAYALWRRDLRMVVGAVLAPPW
ncbi:hypothetical protein [Modestobacter sp. SYSU DS0657]